MFITSSNVSSAFRNACFSNVNSLFGSFITIVTSPEVVVCRSWYVGHVYVGHVNPVGVEPMISGSAIPCSATELRRVAGLLGWLGGWLLGGGGCVGGLLGWGGGGVCCATGGVAAGRPHPP